MIDILTVVVPHMLMALAVWRLIHRDDLDQDPALPSDSHALRRPRAVGAASPIVGRDGPPPHA